MIYIKRINIKCQYAEYMKYLQMTQHKIILMFNVILFFTLTQSVLFSEEIAYLHQCLKMLTISWSET